MILNKTMPIIAKVNKEKLEIFNNQRYTITKIDKKKILFSLKMNMELKRLILMTLINISYLVSLLLVIQFKGYPFLKNIQFMSLTKCLLN
jgi:hypothetical protein